jgi:hypothetical protein
MLPAKGSKRPCALAVPYWRANGEPTSDGEVEYVRPCALAVVSAVLKALEAVTEVKNQPAMAVSRILNATPCLIN